MQKKTAIRFAPAIHWCRAAPSFTAVIVAALILISCRVEPVASFESGQSSQQDAQTSRAPLPDAPTVPLPVNARFDNLNLEAGLSQSTVFCGLQDSQGYLWFGTEDGLNRYDGYNFKVFRQESGNPNSLSGVRISAMIEDHTGVVWIGTEGGGVTRYDPRRIT